jgi:hypothetical protein
MVPKIKKIIFLLPKMADFQKTFQRFVRPTSVYKTPLSWKI